MDSERFQKQRAFILEIDKTKQILRQTHLSGRGRRENDAEHAWHIALMIYLLREYANQPFDLAKTMMMALVHDLVEIDAGDTYAYDPEAKKTEAERERRAADRIFGMLPKDQGQELRALWEEFEAHETPEARFAHVMDNFQPMLLCDSNGGSDWEEHGVHRAQVEQRNEKTPDGASVIWDYMKSVIDRNVERGSICP